MNSFYKIGIKNTRKAGFYRSHPKWYNQIQIHEWVWYGGPFIKVRHFVHNGKECWTVEVVEKPLVVKTYDCADFGKLTTTLAGLGFEIR